MKKTAEDIMRWIARRRQQKDATWREQQRTRWDGSQGDSNRRMLHKENSRVQDEIDRKETHRRMRHEKKQPRTGWELVVGLRQWHMSHVQRLSFTNTSLWQCSVVLLSGDVQVKPQRWVPSLNIPSDFSLALHLCRLSHVILLPRNQSCANN